MQEYDGLEFTRERAVATITPSRPDKLTASLPTITAALTALAEECDERATGGGGFFDRVPVAICDGHDGHQLLRIDDVRPAGYHRHHVRKDEFLGTRGRLWRWLLLALRFVCHQLVISGRRSSGGGHCAAWSREA